jgi:hypothetical protein
MPFQALLSALGVTEGTLSTAEAAELDRDGFTMLPGVLDAAQVAGIHRFCDDLIEHEGVSPDADGGSCHRIHYLIDRSPLFDVAWSHPRILAAIWHVLQDEFRPANLNYRSPLPGGGNQHLHSDDTWTDDGRYGYAQAIIPLVDITAENGAPRFVPGTHRERTKRPPHEMADVCAPHPREVKPSAKAGTAIIFNGNLWHSGTTNASAAPRPVLHMGFYLRHPNNARLGRGRELIRTETSERLSPSLRHFLDAPIIDPGGFAHAYQAEVLKPFRELASPTPVALTA